MTCTCRIVPPSLLRRIAERGSPQQRAAALAHARHRPDGAARPRHLPAARERRAQGADVAPASRPASAPSTTPAAPRRCPGAWCATRMTGRPATSPSNEAFDGLGATFDFYRDVLDRNSIDDEGCTLDATRPLRREVRQRVLERPADGVRRRRRRPLQPLHDRRSTSSATSSTHGVTGDEAGLVYLGQPGALNESISDVFGSASSSSTRAARRPTRPTG